MVFLRNFTLLDELQEHDIVCYEERRQIFNNYYPLHLFSTKEFKNIDFDKITIFYGGNGSGKTTLINMISEKLNASRRASFSKGSYFDLYVEHCKYNMSFDQPMEIKLLMLLLLLIGIIKIRKAIKLLTSLTMLYGIRMLKKLMILVRKVQLFI